MLDDEQPMPGCLQTPCHGPPHDPCSHEPDLHRHPSVSHPKLTIRVVAWPLVYTMDREDTDIPRLVPRSVGLTPGRRARPADEVGGFRQLSRRLVKTGGVG